MVGDETAPNNAPSHSFFKTSTVSSGKAVPVFLNNSKPASKLTNSNCKSCLAGKFSKTALPAGITSRPIPSPEIKPIFKDFKVVEEVEKQRRIEDLAANICK